jgi:hypothetical protein
MSDWEAELENDQEQENKKEETSKNKDEDDDWERELTIDSTENKPKIELPNEEESLIKIIKEIKINQKNLEKEKEVDYEKKWVEKNKFQIEREAEAIKALEGLDEKTKEEKIKELKQRWEANIVEEDEKTSKLSEYDIKSQKLMVQNDFMDMAVGIAGKMKILKKQNFFYSFLKKINTSILEDLSSDLKHEVISQLKVIQNRIKQNEKVNKKESNKNITTPAYTVSSKKMQIEGNVEINPDYVPRNAAMYDDFM